ncbi:MAG: PTS sugar transporter subunit IIB [Lachnospiraceae bacterium]|nr:PTS sugar transporter subunit IIB [Lachnospiraceae bacterium]MCI9624619.1 PTS sugar transporter subunit IIB [Lachnospiraceae bacterium]
MNNIVLARVDNRLVHGQIVVYWSKEVEPHRIAIVDEVIAKDDAMKMIYKLAAPKNYKMSILPPRKFIDNLNSGKYGNERILVLFQSVERAYQAIEMGLEIESLQLGNCPRTEETFAACDYIFLTEKDYTLLEALSGKGQKIYMQSTPGDRRIPFETVIGKHNNTKK